MNNGNVLYKDNNYMQPPIPLIHPDTGEKIKLSLRRMTFQREISSLDLPVDVVKIHHMMIHSRTNQYKEVYNMITYWYKLKVDPLYYQGFGFGNEDEYLAYYNLPCGRTLAALEVIVQLFDKATFILVGDQVLDFMMRMVSKYQNNPDEKKKDYQAIFDAYCSFYDGFEKTAFYDRVKRFVIEKYEMPLAAAQGLTHEQWILQKRKGKRHERIIVPLETGKQKTGPTIEKDFTWIKDKDATRDAQERAKKKQIRIQENSQEYPTSMIVQGFQKYAAELEAIIRKNLGDKFLPERPPAIRNL